MTSRPAADVLGLRFDRLRPAAWISLAMALAALWLLGRRYGGFTHDATLYAALGLRRLDPASFGKDLFFAYGSQDAYTLFPLLYAPLIEAIGLGPAAMAMTIAGQLAFLAAAAALVLRLERGPVRWWSLAVLATVSGYYGGVGVFRIAETFATARTVAEPLVVAALAVALAARPRKAWALLAAAAAFHPLVAAPGIASLLLWHALTPERRFRTPAVLMALVAIVGAAAALIAYVPELALRFDPPWRDAVLGRSPHLFLSEWLAPDWARVLWGLCVAWLALRFLEPAARRLLIAVVAIGATGIVVTGVTVDLLGSALAAGSQPWRTHWLMHLFAVLLVPVAVAGLWKSGASGGRAAAVCLAASLCFGRAELPAAALLTALAVILAAMPQRLFRWMGADMQRFMLVAALCAAAAGLMFEVQGRLPLQYGAIRTAPWADYLHAAGSVGGLLPLALLLWLAACSRFVAVSLLCSTAALALGIAAWDARAPWPRLIDRASGEPHPFRSMIVPGDQVFWPDPHSPPWLVLRTPTWFSVDQGAGIVFHRATAIEYAERKRASNDLMGAIADCRMAGSACRIEMRRARALCERAGGPDYLVLNGRIDEINSIAWVLPQGVQPGAQTLRLYACRNLRLK